MVVIFNKPQLEYKYVIVNHESDNAEHESSLSDVYDWENLKNR